MAKSAGLGANFYVTGVDLSGDTGSVGTIAGGPAPLDVTGIDKSAPERIGGLRDGRIEWSSWFNPAAGAAHPTLSALPTTDVIVSYLHGTTLGDSAASMVAKQINYDPTRGQDGSLAIAVQSLANSFGLEWGDQLTAGIDTLTSAGSGTGVDYGATVGTTNFGLQAYLHVFAFSGTSATVAIQDSDDNASSDPYANVTGGVFTAATGVTAERIQTGRAQAVKRWLRVNVTGTFSDLDFSVMVVKNLTSTVF